MLISALNGDGDLGPKMRMRYLEKLERRRHSADSIVGHAHLVYNEEKEHCDIMMIMIMRRKDPHFILMVIRMRRVIMEPQVHERQLEEPARSPCTLISSGTTI